MLSGLSFFLICLILSIMYAMSLSLGQHINHLSYACSGSQNVNYYCTHFITQGFFLTFLLGSVGFDVMLAKFINDYNRNAPLQMLPWSTSQHQPPPRKTLNEEMSDSVPLTSSVISTLLALMVVIGVPIFSMTQSVSATTTQIVAGVMYLILIIHQPLKLIFTVKSQKKNKVRPVPPKSLQYHGPDPE